MRLINADELKELYSGDGFYTAAHFRTAIDEMPTVSLWHSVKEPPKEDCKYVAINVNTKWWYEASYDNGNWKAVDLFGQRWVVIHPTHWMPVELPREEN